MTTFADLGLSPSTVQAVADTGYTQPTPIQEQAVPVALSGRDVLGIAQTGTGKTAAFTLPMIDRLSAGRAKARMPRSLVICPTRELADQVAASFDKYAKGTKLSWALLIGGVSFSDQEAKLDRGVDVLIATPGRLLDFYERRKIMLLDVKTLVVDEADRMLDMGFIPDLEKIFEITPKQKQTLFFSATMPPEITRLTTAFLKDPTRIEVSRPATTNENITQFVTHLPTGEPKAKRMALRALIERAAPESGIVFCNRKSEVDIVAKSLQKYGMDAAPIHGDLDQSQRMKTLEMFRKGELKLLVASDVAARGLDIPQVSDIFNFDVPHHADDYVHRIGRTGRAGRKGEAFMIVTPNDERGYDKVVKLIKIEPETLTLDIDWAEAEAAGKRDRERHGGRREREGRGRGRERERDKDRRDRPVADHGQRASMDAISTPEPGDPAPVEERSSSPPREAAQEAPRRERGDRPRREGREARGQREPREERPRSEEQEAQPQREARPETEARPEREARPAREARPEREESSSRRGERDRDRGPRRDRGGERDWRWDRDDRPVVGFGAEADTPAFLLRSAAAAIAALQNAPEEPEEPTPVRNTRAEVEVIETSSEVEDVETAAPPAERTRSRRRRRGGERAEIEASPDAAHGVAPGAEAELELAEAAETSAAEAAVSGESEPSAEPVAQGAEPVELAAEAPAPKRRTRRKSEPQAAEAAPDAQAASPGEEAPPAAAPVRARRTRKPAAAPVEAEADATPAPDAGEPSAEPATPARRRSRRKADAVAETAAEALPDGVVPG